MSPSDLEYFISHLQIVPPLASTGIPADIDLATRANAISSYLYGTYSTEYKNGRSFWQRVLIDTSDPTLYRVYLEFGGG